MGKRVSGSKRTVAIFLFFVIGLFCAASAFGSECHVINISKSGGSGSGGYLGPDVTAKVAITPEKLTVKVGACTVWVNFVFDQVATVSFRENAVACEKAATAATGFFMDKSGEKAEACYITEKLPFGKTSSITWSEPGVYKYTIELAGAKSATGKQLFQGVIEVK